MQQNSLSQQGIYLSCYCQESDYLLIFGYNGSTELITSIRHLWRWAGLRQCFSGCFHVCSSNFVFKKSLYSGTFALSGAIVLCQVWRRGWLPPETKLSAFRKSLCLTAFSGFFSRVINAGKSTHNEDQASCEVLTVKKKAGAITSTPNRNSTKRRSSLPNGEGLQLKENSVRPSFTPGSWGRGARTLWPHSEMFKLHPGLSWKREKQCPQS